MAQLRLFRWGDTIPMILCFVLAGVLLVVGLIPRATDCAVVQTPQGNYRLVLSADSEQVFEGRGGLSVTVMVKDGMVSVSKADCDDQVCVHTGKLGGAVRSIACLPAGIVVTWDTDENAPDAITR